MEKICKNCKHWQEYGYEPTIGVKRCKRAEMIWEVTEWREEGEDLVRDIKEEFKNEKHFVRDGSDYAAYLLTKEDFGCNQFES